MRMPAAPSIIAATRVTSLTDGTVNGRKRSNTGAKTIASASASITINSAMTTDATAILHPDDLPHARARNHLASMASEPSPPDYDKPTTEWLQSEGHQDVRRGQRSGSM